MARMRLGISLAFLLASSAYAATIAGKVVDEKGNPIPKAEITFMRTSGPPSDPQQPPPMTTAGDDGSFRFEAESARYVLGVSQRGGPSPFPTLIPDFLRPTIADARPGKDILDMRIVLFHPPVITGTVRDSDGDPVPWASVTLFRYVVTIQHR